jgi:hypothetical protein
MPGVLSSLTTLGNASRAAGSLPVLDTKPDGRCLVDLTLVTPAEDDMGVYVIKAEHFLVRGRLVIPVTDAAPDTEFDWGVWVSLSRDNFTRAYLCRPPPGGSGSSPTSAGCPPNCRCTSHRRSP